MVPKDLTNATQLRLDQCPHCRISHPLMRQRESNVTSAFDGSRIRVWWNYACSTCGGVVLTEAQQSSQHKVDNLWPSPELVPEEIPERAREYLRQALASPKAPSGAIVLAASAIDSMLREKGYKEGKLYPRILQATADHLITEDMSAWAHDVRLDANGERHADDALPMPEKLDADRAIGFAMALGEFLFVLPAMVARGRQASIKPRS